MRSAVLGIWKVVTTTDIDPDVSEEKAGFVQRDVSVVSPGKSLLSAVK